MDRLSLTLFITSYGFMAWYKRWSSVRERQQKIVRNRAILNLRRRNREMWASFCARNPRLVENTKRWKEEHYEGHLDRIALLEGVPLLRRTAARILERVTHGRPVEGDPQTTVELDRDVDKTLVLITPKYADMYPDQWKLLNKYREIKKEFPFHFTPSCK